MNPGGALALGATKLTEPRHLVAHSYERRMPDNTLRNQIVTNYWPIPGGRDVGVEGSTQTSRPGPNNGPGRVSTLEDLRLGRANYVTIASDPSRYGQWFTIPSYTYVNAAGERHTLTNVPAHVHDTGSAFQGRPEKMDVAADYSTTERKVW